MTLLIHIMGKNNLKNYMKEKFQKENLYQKYFLVKQILREISSCEYDIIGGGETDGKFQKNSGSGAHMP
ncbi:hypothetical protein SAMN02746089_01237 [Caldanaerobius fijiensis DSM 17918]|uniref:Uncharacterized protein n=1 Tax=Caldanaerobius fijiensis DSM 17918 TaxID=1121256 RepID=A0A1M4YLV2_9THEO|nr:hypothetical protein SAMN02746089_01237 [Caldanaerobius fijiensis DSM 17918]